MEEALTSRGYSGYGVHCEALVDVLRLQLVVRWSFNNLLGTYLTYARRVHSAKLIPGLFSGPFVAWSPRVAKLNLFTPARICGFSQPPRTVGSKSFLINDRASLRVLPLLIATYASLD